LPPELEAIAAVIPSDIPEQTGEPITTELLVKLRDKLHGAPRRNFGDRIQADRRKVRKIGMLLYLADDVGQVWLDAEARRAREALKRAEQAAQARETNIASLRASLENPDTPEDERALANEILESLGAKADTAGG
jgi:hypothetical protein